MTTYETGLTVPMDILETEQGPCYRHRARIGMEARLGAGRKEGRMSERMPERRRSGVAVGFSIFAATMMILIGSFHAIAGLAAIFEDTFYKATPNYILEFDVTTWGWVHLIVGIVVVIAGFALFSGALWARTVAVFIAVLSAIANFAFIPYQPVWSLAIIAIDVFVIWALTAHGRDIVE
jgi:hypothetical protein